MSVRFRPAALHKTSHEVFYVYLLTFANSVLYCGQISYHTHFRPQENRMFCHEIIVHSNGKIEHRPHINLYRFGIEIGGGGRQMPSVHISSNMELRYHVTTNGIPNKDHQVLTEAEILVGSHGKPLLVRQWTSSLLSDKALVLCRVFSSGKSFISPGAHITTWAHGQRWRNPRPANYASLGIVAECLMVMECDSSFTWRQVHKKGKETLGAVLYRGRRHSSPFCFTDPSRLKATG